MIILAQSVIPAKAGIQAAISRAARIAAWAPACAGATPTPGRRLSLGDKPMSPN